MISQTVNVPLTQKELKQLTVLTSGFVRDSTSILQDVRQHGGHVDEQFIKTSIEVATLLLKLNTFREGAISLEITELDLMFNLPSVTPSVSASDDEPSAANGDSE